ncbi:MAG: AtpZ/AtpI family protein [Candidatus Gastranaerophilales bacterium]|nr:AtpZ/AtpI family protein [Candidatus Gastranaerophilales bacterium]
MAGRKKRGFDKSVYRSFALIMQFGINMLVPICMMSALGIFLDQKFGTSYVMIILFFVGAIAGGQNVYRMAKHVYDKPTEEVAGAAEQEKSGGREEGGRDAQKGE